MLQWFARVRAKVFAAETNKINVAGAKTGA